MMYLGRWTARYVGKVGERLKIKKKDKSVTHLYTLALEVEYQTSLHT